MDQDAGLNTDAPSSVSVPDDIQENNQGRAQATDPHEANGVRTSTMDDPVRAGIGAAIPDELATLVEREHMQLDARRASSEKRRFKYARPDLYNDPPTEPLPALSPIVGKDGVSRRTLAKHRSTSRKDLNANDPLFGLHRTFSQASSDDDPEPVGENSDKSGQRPAAIKALTLPHFSGIRASAAHGMPAPDSETVTTVSEEQKSQLRRSNKSLRASARTVLMLSRFASKAPPPPKFKPNKVLQRAAHRAMMTRAFDSSALLKKSAESLGYAYQGKADSVTILKDVLSSDKNMREIVELTYDPKRLAQEVRAIIKRNQQAQLQREKEERRRLEAEKRDKMQRMRENSMVVGRLSLPKSQSIDDCDFVGPAEEEQDDHVMLKQVLGDGMSKDEFIEMIGQQDPVTANQTVIARLMQVKTNRIVTNKQVVAEQGQESQSEAMSWMRFYKCIDPESYFMTIWTIAFVTLIIYISTVGLMVNTFDLDVETMSSDCKWSAFAWFDLAVDTFFVIDIFGRAFLFGVTVDSGRTWSGELPEAILQPDIVFRRYVKQGMTLDIVTGFPLQWVIMSRFSPCESAGDLSTLRLLRIFRVTRVFKIFQRPIIRKWMRLLRRRVGNNNVLQIWSHLATVVFFTHVWSCLSWMIQALDQDDPNGDGRSGFDEWKDALMIDPPHWFGQYTILFSVTLQNLFAIEPYHANTTIEGWFGILTLLIAVVINATMLSKILEIWTAFNKAQNDRDERLNNVMQFLRLNGIVGGLRNDILDFFEFQYSTNNDLDNHRTLLNHLPSQMQSRVVHRIFPNALDGSYLFRGTNEAFVAQCVLRMSMNSLRTVPGQVVTAQGTLGTEMFLLQSGGAEVTIKDASGPSRSVGQILVGQCFGEISLWIESKRSATIISTHFSQYFILTRDDLEELLLRFPEMHLPLASNGIAACLRVPSMAPAVAGIERKVSERLGRRMAYAKEEFEEGQSMIQAGEQAKVAYVIRTGKVVSEIAEGRLELLSELRIVGLTELFAQRNYLETVKATGMVLAYKLTLEDVEELLGSEIDQLSKLRVTARQHYEVVRRAHLWLRWHLLMHDKKASHDLDSETEPSTFLAQVTQAVKRTTSSERQGVTSLPGQVMRTVSRTVSRTSSVDSNPFY